MYNFINYNLIAVELIEFYQLSDLFVNDYNEFTNYLKYKYNGIIPLNTFNTKKYHFVMYLIVDLNNPINYSKHNWIYEHINNNPDHLDILIEQNINTLQLPNDSFYDIYNFKNSNLSISIPYVFDDNNYDADNESVSSIQTNLSEISNICICDQNEISNLIEPLDILVEELDEMVINKN